MPGSIEAKVAVARTVADRVEWVNHQIRANCTNWLPRREKACPVHITKKDFRQLEFCSLVTLVSNITSAIATL
jgi:hypothetical protein